MEDELINEYFEAISSRKSLGEALVMADNKVDTVFNQIVKRTLGWATGDFIIQRDGRKALVLYIFGWVNATGATVHVSTVGVSVFTKAGVLSKRKSYIYGFFDQIKPADQ